MSKHLNFANDLGIFKGRWNMNDLVGIVRVNYFRKQHRAAVNTIQGQGMARREPHIALLRSFHSTEDDVLLKDFVVFEGHVASPKGVDVTNCHVRQEKLSEGEEIRPIAEATRCDGDYFAVRCQQLN